MLNAFGDVLGAQVSKHFVTANIRSDSVTKPASWCNENNVWFIGKHISII